MEEACTSAAGNQKQRKKKAPPPPPVHAPYMEDWANARSFVNFLKVLYDYTVKFSYSTRVTSDEFLFDVNVIHRTLNTWIKSSNLFLSSMGNSYLLFM